MTESLGPEARALLDEARGGMAPDAATVRRIRARLDVAMTAAAVRAPASKLALVAKLAGVALAVIAIGAIAYVRRDRDGARVAMAPSAPVVAPLVIAPPPSLPPPAPAVEVAAPAPAIKPEPAHVSKPAAHPIGLAREVELVDLAMAALHRGDPRTALRTVAEHARETAGHGQLAEDAAAIEVEALCQLRDPASADKLAAFDRRFPRSAQRARITAACP